MSLTPILHDPNFFRRQVEPISALRNSRFDWPRLWNGSATFEQHSDQTAPCLVEVCDGLFG